MNNTTQMRRGIRVSAVAGLALTALALAAAPAASASTTHWAITATIPSHVPGGQGAEYSTSLAIDETRNIVYAASFYSGDTIDPSNPVPESSKVFTIDGSTDQIVDALDLSCGCDDHLDPFQFVVDPVLNKLFIPYYGSGTVTAFSGYGGPGTPVAVAQDILIDNGNGPDGPDSLPFGAALDPTTHTVHVVDGNENGWQAPVGGRIYSIDGETYALTRHGDDGSIDPLLGFPSFDSTTSTLLVPVASNTYVATFAATGSDLVEGAGLYPQPGWDVEYPTLSAVSGPLHRLYVGNYDSHNVTVYDTTLMSSDPDASAMGLIDLDGESPTQIDVDTERNLLFVSTSNPALATGHLWVIDSLTNAIIDRIEIPGEGTSSVRVNDATGKVYVASYDPVATNTTSSIVVLAQVADAAPELAATGAADSIALLPLAAGLIMVGVVAVSRTRRRMN